jgi:hypothetical protein
VNAKEENELAKSYGFTPYLDSLRGDEWCKFLRKQTVIWQSSRGWARAKKIDGYHTNYSYHKTLEEALKHEDVTA